MVNYMGGIMTELLARNGKMKKANVRLFNFGIPAFQSVTGFKTCPNAGICAKYCYAKKGMYRFSNVANAYETRLEMTKHRSFVDLMNHEIRINKAEYVRIHDSGDFYSMDYLQKWLHIMEENPLVQFYAYTKQVHYFKDGGIYIPTNFTPIFSLGGKKDHLIDTEHDRHSKIFKTVDELLNEDYANASEHDLVAINPINNKIGLLSH
jgi:hypothetical protein